MCPGERGTGCARARPVRGRRWRSALCWKAAPAMSQKKRAVPTTTGRPPAAAAAARKIEVQKDGERGVSPSPFSPLLEPGQEAAGGPAEFELRKVNGTTLQPEKQPPLAAGEPAGTQPAARKGAELQPAARKRAGAQPARKKSHKKRKCRFADHLERPDGLEEEEALQVFWVPPSKAAPQEAASAQAPEEQIDFAQYGGVVQPDRRPDGGPVVLPGVMELPASQYDGLFALKPWGPPVHYIRYAP